MTRSPERRPRMPDVGGFLARLLRAAASALDRRRARQAASDDPLEVEMAALRRRYPDAPEHWLRFVAERTPAPAIADPRRGERDSTRGSALRHASSPATPSRKKRVVAFARREGKGSGEAPGTRQDAATGRYRHDDPARGDAKRYKEHGAPASQRADRGRRAVETRTSRPERTSRAATASKDFFPVPRFRPQPSPQQKSVARNEVLPEAATKQSRVLTSFVFSDSEARFDSRGLRILPDAAPGQPSAPEAEPAVTRQVSRKRPLPPREGSHPILRTGSTPVKPAFMTPRAARNHSAGKEPGAAALHTGPEKRLNSYRETFGGAAAMPGEAGRAREAAFAPDEPKWPELPESSRISPGGEQAPFARGSSAPQEPDRWNGLPF